MPIISKFLNAKRFSNALSKLNMKKGDFGDDACDLNIVIHLRKGDTAVFPLADGRLVSSWGDYRKESNRRALPEIIKKLSDSIYLQCDIEPYLALIENTVGLTTSKINLSFLCDGFNRGIDRVRDKSELVELSPEDFEYIEAWAVTEEQRLKQSVSDMLGCGVNAVDILWGEGNKLFERSFQSIEAADILLLSSGGFARSIFNYFNNVPGSILIGPCTQDTAASDIHVITQAMKKREEKIQSKEAV